VKLHVMTFLPRCASLVEPHFANFPSFRLGRQLTEGVMVRGALLIQKLL
jgi:hypothetical protein